MEITIKSDPGSDDVHVPVPMGGRRQRKPKPAQDASKADARALKPMDNGMAHTPFPHDPNALGNIRADQAPRFFGAMTDQADLPSKKVKLSQLTAMQNRVDPEKVAAMQETPSDKPPLVVRMNGRHYIADGHHRAAAAYLNGDDQIDAKFVNLEPVDHAVKFDKASVCKVDESLGLVFGYAIVCKEDGEDYYDVQDDHIPEDAMLKAACDFMESARVAKDMHDGDQIGSVVFAFPMTSDISKALGIDAKKTGLLIGMKPGADVLAKFKSGDYAGFSIGGQRVTDEEAE